MRAGARSRKTPTFSESIVGTSCAKAIEHLVAATACLAFSRASACGQFGVIQPEHEPQLRSHREAHHPSVRAKRQRVGVPHLSCLTPGKIPCRAARPAYLR